jgi:hypothetical protein
VREGERRKKEEGKRKGRWPCASPHLPFFSSFMPEHRENARYVVEHGVEDRNAVHVGLARWAVFAAGRLFLYVLLVVVGLGWLLRLGWLAGRKQGGGKEGEGSAEATGEDAGRCCAVRSW